MTEDSLKERMNKGETVFGTWCMLPSDFVVDVIAQVGVDFVVLDLEHGTMSYETAEQMVRAAEVHKCQPIIRVGDDRENTILRALETGAEAVMVMSMPVMASEDFCYFLEKVPGCFFFIGTGIGEQYEVHNSHYDFNDEILPIAITLLSQAALKYL